MTKHHENEKDRRHPGRKGDRVSLAPLTFDEAMDVLAEPKPSDTSPDAPRSDQEAPRNAQRQKSCDDSSDTETR